jgi:uncharacterized protein (DUF2147 family)
MVLALLDASAAHAGSVVGALINASGARFAVKNCGTDTCGTIVWGKQKFVVKRSDVPTIFKDLGPRNKATPSERDTIAVIVPPPKLPEASPASAPEDRAAAPRPSEEQSVARTDERPAPGDEAPSTSLEQSHAPPPVVSKIVTEASGAPSPIGMWVAENGEGRVQIDSCGQALCGVVAAAYPDATDVRNPDPKKRNRPLLGVPVLIDMKPTGKERWAGQVYSAKSGYTYAATITLKSADVLRVEGCVLGGLFCSGQTWTRVSDAAAP